ncbi:MAG: hypothetical protein KGI27_04620 [Thaumarchaeota archaeon]|nr:hypothetical protein [Nitrososphaerota archaeon]
MYKFDEEIVEISKLKPCPVRVTLQTDKLLRDLVSVARTRPEHIEPISVAVLGDSMYIANGHLRARALEEAGRNSTSAYLVTAKEISDVVRLHIELNRRGSINPLKMIDAVRFLQKHNAAQSVPKRYLELAEKNIYPKVRARWDEFLADASKRYSSVELPLHVVERIAQFESEKEQLTGTAVLTDSLLPVRESKFVFPAPQDLEMILRTIAPRYHEKKATVFEPKESEKGWPKINREEAEELVRNTPHDSLVQCSCGKKLLLNTKTRQVSSVRDDAKNRCIRLEEEGQSEPVYAIPEGTVNFLGVESGDSLRFLKIRSKKELAKFASSLKDGVPLRLVMISPR